MDKKPTLRVKSLPLILRKGKMSLLNGKFPKGFHSNVNISTLYREDVLHDTTDVYYLKGEYQRMTLVNRFNVITKASRTIAKYFSEDGSVLEKTSDGVTQVVGQEQYKTIFTALCSIIDQELKIRCILALLTAKSDLPARNDTLPKLCQDRYSQTDEMRIDRLKKQKRKRIRRQVGPYVISEFNVPQPKRRKVIIDISKSDPFDESNDSDNSMNLVTAKDNCSVASENSLDKLNIGAECEMQTTPDLPVVNNFVTNIPKQESTESLPDLGHLNDDYSNDSIGKFSALSDTPTLPDLLTNPKSILNNVDQHTKEECVENYIVKPSYRLQNADGTYMILPYKPEDMFHFATKENLQCLDELSRTKLLKHQLMIDYKHCLMSMDEDGNLPIHLAVLNNDVELLNRQCVVLKIRGSSIDVQTKSNGLTALKLALYQDPPYNCELSAALVRHGACPLRADDEHRACAHDAAERGADLLAVTLKACRDNARNILSENEAMWKPEMEHQTDEELGQHLMKYMCSMYDKQGYTPVMLASMLGLYENVRILLEHSPQSVNDKMPTSGNTSLYLAVAAACNSASERGNKSKMVDHFRKTIEILLDYRADPSIDNHAGGNVNLLLTEFNCPELSMLIANKITLYNIKTEAMEPNQTFEKIMLVVDKKGNVEYKKLDEKRKKIDYKPIRKRQNPEVKDKSKPIIVQNVLIKSPSKSVPKTIPAKSPTPIIVKSTNVNRQQYVITAKNANPTKKPIQPIEVNTILKRKIDNPPPLVKIARVDK